jgi:hypothetical protein
MPHVVYSHWLPRNCSTQQFHHLSMALASEPLRFREQSSKFLYFFPYCTGCPNRVLETVVVSCGMRSVAFAR